MKKKHLLDVIAEEYGIKALSQGVSQLLERAPKGVWKDVITTSNALRVLLLTGTSRNSQTVRAAIKWLVQQQDNDTGSWNDEVWDTSAALRALKAAGFELNSHPMKNGIRALLDQYDPQSGCWWDIWETAIAIQCFIALGVESEKIRQATQWLLNKRYPAPQNNWLNLHTTALVLETISNTEFQWDSGVIQAKEWLEQELKKGEEYLDIWSLALSVRALNYYSQPEQKDFFEKFIKSRLIPAINQGNLDTVDLCQVCLTLHKCAPTIMRPPTLKAIVELAQKDQQGLADLFVNIACAWTVGGKVLEYEEKVSKPYVIRIDLTERHLRIIGFIAALASIIGFLVWFFNLFG